AMESIGMVLVTLPAGFIISRFGARRVYGIASVGPMMVNLTLAFTSFLGVASWVSLAASLLLIGLCIPFRIVSMNSTFLASLPRVGVSKAGWYRAALTGGLSLLGPALANLLVPHIAYGWNFVIIAVLFGLMGFGSQFFFGDDAPSLETKAPAALTPGHILTTARHLLRNRDVSESCLLEFTSSATGSLFSAFIIVTAGTIAGLTRADGVSIMLFQGATAVIMLFVAGGLTRRLDKWRGYAIGLISATVALGLLGTVKNFWWLGLGAIFLSAGSAIVHLINMRLLSTHPGEKSQISGLYNLASMSGSVFGAITGGLMTRVTAVQNIYLLWLPLLWLAAAGLFVISRKKVTI
ncbi:MAG TPA: MFS transporter, partial [Asticcacaulis sp.]|nr:MFS transporter [Asticcacaulis sp.]